MALPDGAPAQARHTPSPESSHAPAAARLLVTLTGVQGTGLPELAAALRARLGTAVTMDVVVQVAPPPRESTSEAATPADVTAARARRSAMPAACEPAVTTLTLLAGLDMDCPPHTRDEQEAADAALRAALARAGTPYQVVYGQGEQRIAHALRAIESIAQKLDQASPGALLRAPLPSALPGVTPRRAAWSCEKCSDPECEHKLFTSLLGRSAKTETNASAG